MNEQNQAELLLIAKEAYGVQNEKILDHLDQLTDFQKKLEENLVYRSTKIVNFETPRFYPKKEEHEWNTIKASVVLIPDADDKNNYSVYHQFFKNIRIKGNLKNSPFWYIDVGVGGSRIDRIYKLVYDAMLDYSGLEVLQTNPDVYVMPKVTFPYLPYHPIKFEFEVSGPEINSEDTFQLEYDVYNYVIYDYNIHKHIDKLNISRRILKNKDKDKDNFYYCVQYDYLLDQIQYQSDIINYKTVDKKYIRLNFNHPGDCLCIIINKDLGNIVLPELNRELLENITLVFNQIKTIKLSPSKWINNMAMYKIPYINFSAIDNIKLAFDRLALDIPKESQYYNIDLNVSVYLFNIQLMHVANGMAGLEFSK